MAASSRQGSLSFLALISKADDGTTSLNSALRACSFEDVNAMSRAGAFCMTTLASRGVRVMSKTPIEDNAILEPYFFISSTAAKYSFSEGFHVLGSV